MKFSALKLESTYIHMIGSFGPGPNNFNNFKCRRCFGTPFSTPIDFKNKFEDLCRNQKKLNFY